MLWEISWHGMHSLWHSAQVLCPLYSVLCKVVVHTCTRSCSCMLGTLVYYGSNILGKGYRGNAPNGHKKKKKRLLWVFSKTEKIIIIIIINWVDASRTIIHHVTHMKIETPPLSRTLSPPRDNWVLCTTRLCTPDIQCILYNCQPLQNHIVCVI